MRRLLALTLAFFCAGASSLHARPRHDEGVLVARRSVVAREGIARPAVVKVTGQTSPQEAKKSFWKSPWPYLIAGAVVVAVVVAARASGSSAGTSSGSGGY